MIANARVARWIATGALAVAVACTALTGPSRVREGALYHAGEPQYDAYFKDVHDVQLVAAGWADDKKASRKPLYDALDLPQDAADSTIAQMVHEKIDAAQAALGTAELKVTGDDVKFVTGSGSRGSVDAIATALEATAKTELARAHKLKDLPSRVDALLKTGHELEPHAKEDFAKVGGQKPYEVKAELTASFDVLGSIQSNAKREVRGAEAFVADLQRAVALGASASDAGAAPSASSAAPTKPPPPRPQHPAGTGAPKPPPASTGAPKPPPPKPPVADNPPPKPPPAPKPKPASTGEVFNP
jgi:hypothetical protein